MENDILSLEPEKVWYFFNEICKIPRPSGKEERIIKYLLDFAKARNLESVQDKAGNVLILKPASKGKEKTRPTALQSHIDMVCEKNSDVSHNFETDPIIPVIDGDWLKAEGTTLGADDGIGIAVQLALLDTDIPCIGPIECLFTVDEETGLTGAFGLEPGLLKSKILLNLDSEDEGQLFIGCAGGRDTVATFKYRREKIPAGYSGMTLRVSGLKGGHSGDDINKGFGNAVKILTRLLIEGMDYSMRIGYIRTGNLRNALAREGLALLAVESGKAKSYILAIEQLAADIKAEFHVNDPLLKISITQTDLPAFLIDEDSCEKLLLSLQGCPHGVLAMSADIPDLVETSTNLASVKMKGITGENDDDDIKGLADDEIRVATSQRSSLESAKKNVVNMVASVFRLAGAQVTHSAGYPGWKPNLKSEILEITCAAYRKLYGSEPQVLAIHAGLECGLIGEKYPDMDMISYGPTLRGVHAPGERIRIDTVERFWDLTIEILENI